ncbi:MAG: mandelate racemase/muconate lactonizing enzyme family protein [Armatimonadetes bacterium]|nr:mandelate racemase/muconate lactonizing enzyme family protein [Armatimonadota bacterium]
MRITEVVATHLSIPLKDRFWMSLSPIGGMQPKVDKLLLEIRTDAGISGWGEAGPGGARLFERGFGELLVGEDPLMVERLWHKLFAVTHTRTGTQRGWDHGPVLSAIAAVDIALWDLVGKAAGLPLYRVLGGFAHTIPAYVTGGYYREGKGIPELVEEVQGYVAKGFRAIKLKVGGVSIAEDCDRLAAVRGAIGNAVDIMLDANNGYDLRSAIEAAKAFEAFRIRWFEEPLHWYDDVRPLRALRDKTTLRIASGEGESTGFGSRELIEQGLIDICQFDAHRNGGFTEWRRIAGMAALYHVEMAPHHAPHLHGHLLASIPHGLILESFANPERDPYWPTLYARVPQIVDGQLTLLEEPGLGIEFNKDFVARHGTVIA